MRREPVLSATPTLLLALALVAATAACEKDLISAPNPTSATKTATLAREPNGSPPIAAAPSGSYKASLGTLPEAQGWTYGGDNGNASPVVSQGVLMENTTAGVQYWRQFLPVRSFSRAFVLEARLKIISSNYVPNVGTGTREGYYFMVSDSSSSYTIGLADTGFNINSICVPNQPLTPHSLADGKFHEFKLKVAAGKASFIIDGAIVASNIAPDSFAGCASIPGIVTFGAVSSSSRSVTELKDFVFRTF